MEGSARRRTQTRSSNSWNKKSEQEGGWLAWTRPVSDRLKRTTEALMVTKGKPKRPRSTEFGCQHATHPGTVYLGAAEYAASTGQLEQARDMLEKGLAVEPRDDLKISRQNPGSAGVSSMTQSNVIGNFWQPHQTLHLSTMISECFITRWSKTTEANTILIKRVSTIRGIAAIRPISQPD